MNGSRGTLYLHVTLADLATHSGGGGRVERLGTASLALLRDWLQRLAGVTHPAGPRPGPHRQRSTPTTHPPGCGSWSSSATGTACSPAAPSTPGPATSTTSQPYVPLDEGGPPGQTTPANLACLCRRHHRAKTFAGWRYRRLPDDGDRRSDLRVDQPPPPHLPRPPRWSEARHPLVEVPEPPRGEGLETTRRRAPWPPPRSGAEVSRRLRSRSGAPQPTATARRASRKAPHGRTARCRT